MLRPALAALAAAALTVGLLPAAQAATPGRTAEPASSGDARRAAPRCPERLLESARPAWKVERDQPRRFAAAARVNGRPPAELGELARDRTMWLDSCGRRLYVDEGTAARPPAAAGAGATTDGTTDGVVPADVLTLSSRPGAAKTLYLDFTGDVLEGTYWNDELGSASIAMEPFSLDEVVDTAFSEAERRAIHQAWQAVAEDYAPFDVDVTTRDPGAEALRRDSSSDTTYGSRVLVSNAGVVADWCGGCAGVAVVDVFDLVGSQRDYTQPALVFADSVSGHGPWIGEVGSHEVGHQLGLDHDGRSGSSYYTGQGPWGPVMGAAYHRALSQWSAGEYAGASNPQDDLAIISSGIPYRPDDHADAAGPSPLPAGGSLRGVVERQDDVDTFTFTASGRTTLHARPTSPFANLDLGMTVRDADGAVVAEVDPPVVVDAEGDASGLDARWQVDLSPDPAVYTVALEGVGYADPAVDGYSDYGSLGSYEISLDTGQVVASPDPTATPTTEPTPTGTTEPTPTTEPSPTTESPDESSPDPGLTRALTLPATRLGVARRGVRYHARIRAEGGTGSYRWRVRGELPRGLRARVSRNGTTLRIAGRAVRRGRTSFRVVVRDDGGQRVVQRYVLRVRRQA